MKKLLFQRTKMLVVVSLLVALVSVSFVGETGAWLKHTSGADSTTMTKVTKINDSALTLSGTFPSIKVTNNSNIPMYIRVVMSVNYINTDSNNFKTDSGWQSWELYHAQAPKKDSYPQNDGITHNADFSFSVNGNWLQKNITETVVSGGSTATYYVFYHKAPVSAGGSTYALFSSFTGTNKTVTRYVHGEKRTFSMRVDLLVDGIQCENSGRFSGTPAVNSAWGVTATVGGNITAAPGSDGTVNP